VDPIGQRKDTICGGDNVKWLAMHLGLICVHCVTVCDGDFTTNTTTALLPYYAIIIIVIIFSSNFKTLLIG